MDTEHTTETAKMGRPTVITDDIRERFCAAIVKGHYIEHAASSVGLSKVTVYSWFKRGETGEQPFADFLNAYKAAEFEAVDRALGDIEGARGGKDAAPWTNRAWWLERRHPDKFGRTVQTVEHTGSVATVRVELPDLTGMEDGGLAAMRALAGRPDRE